MLSIRRDGTRAGMAPGRRDEVVLITGCSEGGIGAALAMELCDAGFTVVATSRLMSTMKIFERHQHIHVHELDLLLPDSIKQAVETIITLYERIDILINNAAIPCAGPLAELPIEIVDRTYRTNYLGTQVRFRLKYLMSSPRSLRRKYLPP